MLERVRSSQEIQDKNRKHLLEFYEYCITDGISICKTERYLYDAFRIAIMLGKDMKRATKEDIRKMVVEVERKEFKMRNIITIAGSRSVGKSTISKLVARKLKLKYVSSDKIGDKAFKKEGGLDKAIKDGKIKELIKAHGYRLILDQYNNDNLEFLN